MGMGRAAERIEILNARPPLPAALVLEELDACFVVTDSVVKPAPRCARCQYQIESRINKTPALGLGIFSTQTNRALGGLGGKAPDSSLVWAGDCIELLTLNEYRKAAGAIATVQSLTGRSHDVRHSNYRSDGGDNDNKGGK